MIQQLFYLMKNQAILQEKQQNLNSQGPSQSGYTPTSQNGLVLTSIQQNPKGFDKSQAKNTGQQMLEQVARSTGTWGTGLIMGGSHQSMSEYMYQSPKKRRVMPLNNKVSNKTDQLNPLSTTSDGSSLNQATTTGGSSSDESGQNIFQRGISRQKASNNPSSGIDKVKPTGSSATAGQYRESSTFCKASTLNRPQHPIPQLCNEMPSRGSNGRVASELSNKEKVGSKHNIMDSTDFMLPTQASTDGTTIATGNSLNAPSIIIHKRNPNQTHAVQHHAATSLRSPIEKHQKLLIERGDIDRKQVSHTRVNSEFPPSSQIISKTNLNRLSAQAEEDDELERDEDDPIIPESFKGVYYIKFINQLLLQYNLFARVHNGGIEIAVTKDSNHISQRRRLNKLRDITNIISSQQKDGEASYAALVAGDSTGTDRMQFTFYNERRQTEMPIQAHPDARPLAAEPGRQRQVLKPSSPEKRLIMKHQAILSKFVNKHAGSSVDAHMQKGTQEIYLDTANEDMKGAESEHMTRNSNKDIYNKNRESLQAIRRHQDGVDPAGQTLSEYFNKSSSYLNHNHMSSNTSNQGSGDLHRPNQIKGGQQQWETQQRGSTFQRRQTLNDTFSKEQWSKANPKEAVSNERGSQGVVATIQTKQNDIVEKIRMSYEIISRKQKNIVNASINQGAFSTATGSQEDDNLLQLMLASAIISFQVYLLLAKKTKFQAARGSKKILKDHISKLKQTNTDPQNSAQQLEFNTTFSQGFRPQINKVQPSSNGQSGSLNPLLSLNTQTDLDQVLLSAQVSAVNTSRKNPLESMSSQALAFLKLPQIGNNRASMVIGKPQINNESGIALPQKASYDFPYQNNGSGPIIAKHSHSNNSKQF